jgi:hypothetical protein
MICDERFLRFPKTPDMTRQTIRDRYSRLIGTVIEYPDGRLEARNAYSLLLGRYDPQTDTTRDAYSRLIAHGNMLSGLIWQDAEQ